MTKQLDELRQQLAHRKATLVSLQEARRECEQSDDRYYTNGGSKRNDEAQALARRDIADIETQIRMEEQVAAKEAMPTMEELFQFLRKVEESRIIHPSFDWKEAKALADRIAAAR